MNKKLLEFIYSLSDEEAVEMFYWADGSYGLSDEIVNEIFDSHPNLMRDDDKGIKKK